jgi:predicted MPP superfamily phosphohydrolase
MAKQEEPQQLATVKQDLMPPVESVRLVHLTDLHFGRGFNEALWDHIKFIVPFLKPHVILVTGDLVNSPWRSQLPKIREMLEELKRKSSQDTFLYVVPGNHDTRAYALSLSPG